jgi:hypothetical protein
MQVIANQIVLPLTAGLTAKSIPAGIALVLGLVLMMKISQTSEWIARPIVAFLVGTGTAAAVAGAMLGTLFPQTMASINAFGPAASGQDLLLKLAEATVILLGTVATLAYFQFTIFGKSVSGGQRGRLMAIVALLGQAFIAITLGALFAGAFAAALSALVDRIQAFVSFFELLLFPH